MFTRYQFPAFLLFPLFVSIRQTQKERWRYDVGKRDKSSHKKMFKIVEKDVRKNKLGKRRIKISSNLCAK